MIVKQILLVSTKKNVEKRVWRMWILKSGCKGLNHYYGLRIKMQDKKFNQGPRYDIRFIIMQIEMLPLPKLIKYFRQMYT